MKKGQKDLGKGCGVILILSRSSNLARFRFLCRSKPVSAPFQTRWTSLYEDVSAKRVLDQEMAANGWGGGNKAARFTSHSAGG